MTLDYVSLRPALGICTQPRGFWTTAAYFCLPRRPRPGREAGRLACLMFLVCAFSCCRCVEDAQSHLIQHLLIWQHIAALCVEREWKLFKIRPKMHYVQHISSFLLRTGVNPAKIGSCFEDESFLGRLKRLGVGCHRVTMLRRLLQRYLLFQGMRFQQARQAR
mgnify:CR=1 FL=1